MMKIEKGRKRGEGGDRPLSVSKVSKQEAIAKGYSNFLVLFVLFSSSRPVVRPTRPPFQWVPGALSLGVKRPGPEADHSPPTSAEVKKM
jgi:hypothetical protein